MGETTPARGPHSAGSITRRRFIGGAVLGSAAVIGGRAAAQGGVGYFTDDQSDVPLRPAQRVTDSLRTDWRAVDIGTSVQGRPITMYQRLTPRARASVLVIAAIHGDERGIAPAALGLGAVEAPLDVDLHLVPIANPDGWAAGTRENANGVDLNRNFPFWWDPRDGGPAEASEPETQALMDLVTTLAADVTVWMHEPYAYVSAIGDNAAPHAQAWAEASELPFRPPITQHGGGESWTYHELGLPSILVESPTRDPDVGEPNRHRRGLAALIDVL